MSIAEKLNLCLESYNIHTLSNDEAEILEDNNDLFSQDLTVEERIKYELLINKEVELRINDFLENKLEKILNKRFGNLLKEVKKMSEEKEIINTQKIILNEDIILNNKRTDELNKIENNLNEMKKEIQKKSDDFDNKLIEEKEKLEQKCEKLTLLMNLFESNSKNKYIKINVGGKIFETTENTLKESSLFFKGLLSGNFSYLKDENGNLFVDRSPGLFIQVLNIIRNYEYENFSDDIKKELEYFAIDYFE
jgi:hypothetical protein